MIMGLAGQTMGGVKGWGVLFDGLMGIAALDPSYEWSRAMRRMG